MAPRPPGPIYLLVFILAVWNPASMALHAAAALASLPTRPTLSLVFLGMRLALTSLGVAGGLALWLQRPGAIWLTKLTLVLLSLEATVRLSTRVDLSSAPPGTRLPLALFVILHNAWWYFYIHISRRVRAAYDLESQPDSRS